MGIRAAVTREAPPVPGGGVMVRAAVPGDADGLGRMFSRCSTQTILFRFHSPLPRVPETMLDRLADVPPHLGRSFVAETGGEIVGHAMFAREGEGNREAEVAVVVEDGWSSSGVGRRLLAEVCIEARQAGVETLLCTTLGENSRIQEVARRVFPGARLSFSNGVCDMRLPLDPPGRWTAPTLPAQLPADRRDRTGVSTS